MFAVISDCRFPNEAEAVQRAGGKVIRLTRGDDSDDSHSSEVEVNNIEYDAVIDNKDLSLLETNKKVISLLEQWGWLGDVIQPVVPEPVEDKPELVGGIKKIKE